MVGFPSGSQSWNINVSGVEVDTRNVLHWLTSDFFNIWLLSGLFFSSFTFSLRFVPITGILRQYWHLSVISQAWWRQDRRGQQISSTIAVYSHVRWSRSSTAKAIHNDLQKSTAGYVSCQTSISRLHEGSMNMQRAQTRPVLTPWYHAPHLAFAKKIDNAYPVPFID